MLLFIDRSRSRKKNSFLSPELALLRVDSFGQISLIKVRKVRVSKLNISSNYRHVTLNVILQWNCVSGRSVDIKSRSLQNRNTSAIKAAQLVLIRIPTITICL